MQEKGFDINNNILHFIHNDSDYLINLDLIEIISLYKDLIIFVEYGKVKRVPSDCFDITELTLELINNHNYMVCEKKYIVNLKLIDYVYIGRSPITDIFDQQNVILKFKGGRTDSIETNSWREAERLYHQIDDKLIEIKGNQI